MTDISKTHRLVIDPVTNKGTLVPIVKRYDASTEAKRAGNADKARPASRRKAQSTQKLERSDR